MRRGVLAAVVAAVLLAAGAAPAHPDLDRIETAMATGDVAVLGAEVAQAHRAAEGEGPEALWQFWRAFEVAFSVTRPETQALARRWVEADAGSPYAQAAVALLYQKRAFLRRGRYAVAETPQPALDAFAADMETAIAHARLAVEAAPDTAAGYFVLFNAGMARVAENRAADLAPALLDALPHRGAVDRVVGAYAPAWGWPFSAIAAVCSAHAPQVPDYDAEACMDTAVVAQFGDTPAGAAARERLWSRTEPWLDEARFLDFYETGGLSPFDLSTIGWATDFHRSRIDGLVEPIEWRRQGEQMAMRYQLPLYADEVALRATPFVEASFARDPFDRFRIDDYLDIVTLAKMRTGQGPSPEQRHALWLNGMVYGRDDAWRWIAGMTHLRDWTEADARLPYVANAMAAARNPVTIGSAILWHLGDVDRALAEAGRADVAVSISGVDPATIPDRKARLDCLRLRVARLVEAECAGFGGLRRPGCQRGDQELAAAVALARRGRSEGLCPAVGTAPLADLAFTGRHPLPELDALLARRPDRLD